MPIKKRHSAIEFNPAIDLGPGIYHPLWFDMNASDGCVIVTGLGSLEVFGPFGITIEEIVAGATPPDVTNTALITYNNGGVGLIEANRAQQFPAPIPRFIAIAGAVTGAASNFLEAVYLSRSIG